MKYFLVCIYLFSPYGYAQDMPNLGPGALEKYAFSAEYQQMDAPAGYPDLRIEQQSLGMSIPLYNGTANDLAFIARGQRTLMADDLTFPVSGAEMPQEFGSADFGLAWGREDLSGHKVGFSATYGEAGTNLFAGGSSGIVNATLVFERKKFTGDSWLYLVNYSNNRTFLNNVPLPGIAYVMISRSYTAVFGLPFVFVNWRPGSWSLTASLSPFQAMTDLGWRFWGPLQIYANAGWSPKAYQHLVQGSDDRVIFDKKEAGGGLRMQLGPGTSLSAGYVYHYDRRFMLGEGMDDDDAESYAFPDSAGFQVRAKWTL